MGTIFPTTNDAPEEVVEETSDDLFEDLHVINAAEGSSESAAEGAAEGSSDDAPDAPQAVPIEDTYEEDFHSETEEDESQDESQDDPEMPPLIPIVEQEKLKLTIDCLFYNKPETSNYFWLYNEGFHTLTDWYFMTLENSQLMEDNIINNNYTFNYSINGHNYYYDLNKMIQTNMDTGYRRNLIRCSKEEMDILHNEYLNYLNLNPKQYYCVFNNKNTLYSPYIQKMIQEKLQDENPDKKLYIKLYRFVYLLDLNNFLQINTHTFKTRHIEYDNVAEMDNVVHSFNY